MSVIREFLHRALLKLPVIRFLNARLSELETREAELERCIENFKTSILNHDSILRTESLIGLPAELVEHQASTKRSDDFFKHLEFQYRGTFKNIVRSLECYLPLLEEVPRGALALDLGCGRGEWLSILSEQGIRGVGVDLNQDKVAEANELGYTAECQDAVQFLQSQDEDLSLVTMFHVVEHLPLNYLIALLDLAFSKLSEGGLLLMEMPNIGNAEVGNSGFFMDPSHRKPIPPHLLSFMAQNSRFQETELLFLKRKVDSDGLRDIFSEEEGGSTCPDVAVLARKKGMESTF